MCPGVTCATEPLTVASSEGEAAVWGAVEIGWVGLGRVTQVDGYWARWVVGCWALVCTGEGAGKKPAGDLRFLDPLSPDLRLVGPSQRKAASRLGFRQKTTPTTYMSSVMMLE